MLVMLVIIDGGGNDNVDGNFEESSKMHVRCSIGLMKKIIFLHLLL